MGISMNNKILTPSNKMLTRQSRTEDLPGLRRIWSSVFGSPDGAAFFDYNYEPGWCIVAEHDSLPAAMGHLLPIGSLVAGKSRAIPCAMIYAVAALPEHRNRGLGSAVTESLIALANDRGYPAVVLCPSEDRLFEFYASRSNMREWFYVNERTYTSPPTNGRQAALGEVSPDEYMLLRENLLSGIPHISLNRRALEYQAILCEMFGGGMFKIETRHGTGCAVIERQPEGSVYIKELLHPSAGVKPAQERSLYAPDANTWLLDAVAAAAGAFPSPVYKVRTPASSSDHAIGKHSRKTDKKRFAMLAISPILLDVKRVYPTDPWYGLAFD